jgi:hypothetical protein
VGRKGLGFELRASRLQSMCSTAWVTPLSPFCSSCLGDRVSWTTCLGWPQTSILPIAAFQVARIIGLRYQHLAVTDSLLVCSTLPLPKSTSRCAPHGQQLYLVLWLLLHCLALYLPSTKSDRTLLNTWRLGSYGLNSLQHEAPSEGTLGPRLWPTQPYGHFNSSFQRWVGSYITQ